MESHRSLDLLVIFLDDCPQYRSMWNVLSHPLNTVEQGLSSYFRELRMDASDYTTAICGLLRMKELRFLRDDA